MLVSSMIVIIEEIVSINQTCDDVMCLFIDVLSKQIYRLIILITTVFCSLSLQRAFMTKRQSRSLLHLMKTRSRVVFFIFCVHFFVTNKLATVSLKTSIDRNDWLSYMRVRETIVRYERIYWWDMIDEEKDFSEDFSEILKWVIEDKQTRNWSANWFEKKHAITSY